MKIVYDVFLHHANTHHGFNHDYGIEVLGEFRSFSHYPTMGNDCYPWLRLANLMFE